MKIKELKRLAEAAVNSGDVADALAASMDFMEAVDPAAILELIRQRDELLAAMDWLIDRFGIFIASEMTDGDDQMAFDHAMQVRDKVRG